MALQIWLPLNGDLHNQGLSNIQVINHGATIDTTGKLGKSYLFNGTNNYISGTYEATTEISFCAWVRFISIKSAHVFDARTSNGIGYQPIYITSSIIQIGCSGSNYYNINYTWETGKWYHICVTHNANEGKCYINGELIGTSSSVKGANLGQCEFTLGSRCNQANYSNIGLNDIRIYNHCLSEKEVKKIFKGLFLHYQLNDNYISSNNLIRNGFGELGIENWNASRIFTNEIPPNHLEIFASFKDNTTVDYILIQRNCTYELSLYIKASSTSGNTYPSFVPYDVDKKRINYYNTKVGFNLNTMTTLTTELKAGDTKIYVADLSSWNANSGTNYNYAAIFGYQDSTGHIYPDGTYTQITPAFGSGTNAKTNLDKTNNIINLNSAYSGKTIPIGTAVCAAAAGGTYCYPFGAIANSSIQDWTYKTTTISSENSYLIAARYIRFYTYSNGYYAGITLKNLNGNKIVYDSSGYNNNGEIVGNLTTINQSPQYNIASIFNGAYIKKSNMNFTNNYWTISCWFKKTSSVTSAYETMLGLTKGNGADANKKFSLYIYNNKIGCVGEKTSNTNIKVFDTSLWHHACLVNNNGSFIYYMNGINIKTFSNTNCQIDCTDFVVGGRAAEEDAATIGTPWGGNLCDIRLYATALSAEDILNLFAKQ